MNAQVARTLPSLVLLALLSGCPTRFEAGAASHPNSSSESAPGVDASFADSITNISVPDDAGSAAAAAVAADGGDAAEASPPDDPTEMPKLPPPRAAVGSACAVNADCVTGSCVDGICCSSAACGVCQSCGAAGSLGTCSPIPALNEDPKNSCTGTQACDGKGHCAEFNGNACTGTGDCISGFCVDGVCCESACDQTCFSCRTAFQLKGTCQPLTAGTDDVAASPCSGARSCAPGAAALEPLCLLVDGQPCTAASDCVSGQCSTFYADRDGDRYGNAASAIAICGSPDAPPAGYVVTSGDCCDYDGNAHPGQAMSFSHGDSCGSWDYNCDGHIEEQFPTGPCGGYSGPADCGKACVRFLLGSPITTYTQACR